MYFSKILAIMLFLAFSALNAAFCTEQQTTERMVEVEAQRTEVKQKIQKLKLLERIETNKLYRNQQKLEQNEKNLQRNQNEYETAQDRVVSLEYQLEQALSEYESQKSATNKRIVQIYKKKRKNYVEFLLNAKDLNNLLDRLYFENIIMRLDKQRLQESQARTRRIRELRAQIESQKSFLEVNIKTNKRLQRNIQAAIGQNEKLIEKLQNDRATWEKSERELARQSIAIAEMINKTTKTENKNTTAITVTGSFVRPVPGPITSPYGYRTHPIFKKTIFHSGLDIGAPMNTTIKAANSGKVIFSGWYGGYGKVVIIDHGSINGKPTTTLYAHMNTYSVSVGQAVVKGQAIGRVGSTGYSTGPHLHFEVRVSGNTVNPLNYVK